MQNKPFLNLFQMLKFNALSKFGNQCGTAAVPHAALTRNGKIDFPQKYLLKIVRYYKKILLPLYSKYHLTARDE